MSKEKPRTINSPASPPPPVLQSDPRPTGATTLAVLAGLAAAWIASGAVGLLGHGLRHALTWLALGTALVAGWPRGRSILVQLGVLGAVVVACIAGQASQQTTINVAGVALAFAILAIGATHSQAGPLRTAAIALGLFAAYRLLVGQASWAWMAADALGQIGGRLVGWVTGRPLSVGLTFGGVDFLVLMGAFYGLWLAQTSSPRALRAAYGAVGIVLAQVAYLAVLSLVPGILADVPMPTREQPDPEWVYKLPGFFDLTLKLDAVTLRQWLPWNVPAFGAFFQLIVAGLMIRWATWSDSIADQPNRAAATRKLLVGVSAAAVVALAAALSATWSSVPGSLKDKKVVLCTNLFGNFERAKHGDYGHYSIGMYGNFVPFIQSLGGECELSDQLSEADLDKADVVVIIYPHRPWADPKMVDRVWKYVEKGGSLLVMGEHTVVEETNHKYTDSRLYELMKRSKMQVAFDSATFEIGGWLQSYHALAFPPMQGVEDGRNEIGAVIGASVDVKWPAQPLLLGRWGFNDPGDEGSLRSYMGNGRYDAGERLGDVILAGEQRYGDGRVVLFGDTSTLTNGITIGTHAFNARLLSYLANARAASSPLNPARQVVTILVTLLLIGLLIWGRSPLQVIVSSGLMALLVAFAGQAVVATTSLYPDQNKIKPIERSLATTIVKSWTWPSLTFDRPRLKVAYIANSHVGFYSEESWRSEGMMGMCLTLFRNGYLVMMAPDLSARRLQGASLLVMPPPSRSMSNAELDHVDQWVRSGGTLILTVGWDRYKGNEDLLRRFRFYIPSGSDGRPPEPLGHFKAPYIQADNGTMFHVRFHAAWPVACFDPVLTDPSKTDQATWDAAPKPLAYGRGDANVILWRRHGDGKVVMIGDSEFATNKNLEHEGGEPFEGMRENADFWRHLISRVVKDETPFWMPAVSKPAANTPAAAETAVEGGQQ